MINLRAARQQVTWRGYPVQYITEGAWDALSPGTLSHLAQTLPRAVDLAGPGEPADWHFEAASGRARVWLERGDGVRGVERGHQGGHWTVYLPHER